MTLLKSKKFWMAIIGVAGVVLSTYLGVNEDTVMTIGGIVVAAIFGQGLADFGKSAK